ncbi:MAG: acyl transferase [Crocinitomicaceae bacterium]|nr:acyl transferase [Crocinitomicaceae bacterium]
MAPQGMNQLEQRIFSIQKEADFERVALDVYRYQVEHCAVYREYVQQLNWKEPKSSSEIPFLPISFFKSHRIIAGGKEEEVVFKSSGTGGERSQHFVYNAQLYKSAFRSIYAQFIGEIEEQVVLALLPNYLDQGDSSLVYMVDDLIKLSNNASSQFLLNDLSDVEVHYKKALSEGKKVVIFGVAYSLLDLCELNPKLSEATIIETGGMKGRRKELTKQELHTLLKEGLNCQNISSEYGMTELLSQAYSNENGIFETCPWMKISIRETNDPFNYIANGKTGGVNIIDLANLYSCSFIATQDLGRISDAGFEIMGRFDHSDVRGCNLLVE